MNEEFSISLLTEHSLLQRQFLIHYHCRRLRIIRNAVLEIWLLVKFRSRVKISFTSDLNSFFLFRLF